MPSDDWQLPEKTEEVPWAEIGSLPLDRYEVGGEFNAIDKWTERAMRFKIDPQEAAHAQPDDVVKMTRLMQLLLYAIDRDAAEVGKRFMKTNEDLKRANLVIKKSSGNSSELVTQRDEALAEVMRLKELLERQESDNSSLRQEAHDLRQNLTKATKDKERADASAASAEVAAKRLEGEVEVLRQAAQTQRREASSLAAESTEASLLVQRLAEQVRDLKAELETEQQKATRIEVASAAQVQEAKRAAESYRLQNVTLEDDLQAAEAAREQAETAVAEVERDAAESMTRLETFHEQMMAAKQTEIDQARDELNDAMNDLRAIKDSGIGDTSMAHGALRIELKKKDETIAQLREALDDAVREAEVSTNFGKTGGGPGGFAGGLGDKERKELIQLRQDIVRTERELDDVSNDLHQKEKLLALYRDKDNSIEKLSTELDLNQRALDNLQAVNEQLNERLSSHDDIIDYCENLKALCLRIGVTETEMEQLNVRGAKTEIQTLRQQVLTQQEEIEWLERERKHWIQKVRLQPLLEAQLQLKVGLSPEQKAIVDDIVQNMRRGTYTHDDAIEQANLDFRDKYHEEVKRREADHKAFNEIVLSKLETGLDSVIKAHANDINRSGGLNKEVADELKELLQSAAARGGPGIGVGADSELVRELRESVAEQTALAKAQAARLEQLDRTLTDQLRDVVQYRERASRAEEDARNAAEERDRFRECLVGRGDPGASYTAAAESTVHTAGSPLRASPLRQSSVFLNREGSVGSINNSAHFTSGAHGAADVAIVDKLIAIEHALRKQVRNKDTAIKLLEQRVREAEAGTSQQREAKEKLESVLKTREEEVKLHERNEEDLRALLDETSAKLEEMEKVKADLRATSSDKRLVEKIVQLRSREAKLMTRVRLLHREKEDGLKHNAALERHISECLNDLKATSAGKADAPTCLPTRATRQTEEHLLVTFVQDALTQLHRGELLEADRSVVEDMQNLIAAAAEQQAAFVASADVHSLRAQLETSREQISTLSSELEARRRVEENTSSGGGVAGLVAAGNAHNVAARAAELEVEAETWRQKCSSLSNRLNDKDREIAELDNQLEATRGDLREVRAQYAKRKVTTAHEEQQATAAPTTAAGNTNADGDGAATADGAAAPDDLSVLSSAQETRVNSAHLIRHLENEVARLKGTNGMLLQTLIDAQAERKRMDSEHRATQQQLHLLTEQSTPLQERATEVVARVMREHAALQQEILLATSQAKTSRLRATAAEANVRVLVNEAGTYKLNAFRLYTHYVDHAVGIAQQCRAAFRQRDGALTLRATKEVQNRVVHLADRLAGLEHLHKGALSTCAELQAQLRAAEGDAAAMQATVDTLNAQRGGKPGDVAGALPPARGDTRRGSDESSSVGAHGRGASFNAADVTAGISQSVLTRHVKESADSVRAQQIADLRATNRGLERRTSEAAEEIAFMRSKADRADEFADSLLRQLSRVELLGGASESPFGSPEAAEAFLIKLAEVRDTVHAKSSAPPVAVELLKGSSTASRASSKDEEESLRQYHEALTQHANLVRERGELQANLETTRQQLTMLDTRCGALREELSHAEQRAADTLKMVEEERAKAARREERMSSAHAQQQRIASSAAEHNVRCLKEMLTAKERVVAQLQQQLETDRQRHLEASLLDSTRLERLHEQLHRETASLVDRFRTAVDSGRLSGGTTALGTPGGEEPNVIATLRQALQEVTDREGLLTREVVELRQRNADLQRMLREHQPTAAGAMPIVPTANNTPPSLAMAAGGGGSGAAAPTGESTPLVPAHPHSSNRNEAATQSDPANLVTTGVAMSQSMLAHQGPATAVAATATSPGRAVPPLPIQTPAGSVVFAPERTEAGWIALRSDLTAKEEEIRRLTKELRRAERDLERQKKKRAETAVLKVHAPSSGNAQTSAKPSTTTTSAEPAVAAPPAETQALKDEVASQKRRVKELEKQLKKEQEQQQSTVASHQREQLEALELQSSLEKQLHDVARENAALRRSTQVVTTSSLKAQQQPQADQQPAASGAPAAAAVAAPAESPTPATAAAPGQAAVNVSLNESAAATTTAAEPSAAAASPQPSAATAAASSQPTPTPATGGAAPAVPPSAPTTTRPQPSARTSSPPSSTNALAARVTMLEKRLAEANAKLSSQSIAHRQEVLRHIEGKKSLEAQLAALHQSLPASGARARSASGAAGRGTTSSQRRAAVEAAATEVVLREQLATVTKDLAAAKASLATVTAKEAEIAKLQEQNAAHERRAEELVSKLKVSETLRTGGGVANSAIATLRDLRHHKQEMLDVEKRLDDAKLELHKKQAEMDSLSKKLADATVDSEKLRADNMALRAGVTAPSDDAAKKAAASVAAAKAKERRITELEDALLRKDGAMLDLRFERETLQLRVGRLERHLEELVATERRESQQQQSPQQPQLQPQAAASPSRNVGASPRAHVSAARDTTRVAQLEGVVENMKTAIERLHKENAVLKATGVSGSRYVEATREVRALRQRERELQETIQSLNVRLVNATATRADPMAIAQGRGHTAVDHHLTLQRRLRMAEAAADRFKLENDRLKSHLDTVSRSVVGTPSDGNRGALPAGVRPPPASGEPAGGALPGADYPEIIKPEHWQYRLAEEAARADDTTQTEL